MADQPMLPRHPWDKMSDDVTRVPRSQITPAPYNPKQIDVDELRRLKQSLQKNGLRETIVWNKRSGYQIGGHSRLRVLDKNECPEGDWAVPVTVHDLDELEEKQLNTALSNRSAMGRFDDFKLADILKTPNISIEACAFDIGQIKTILPSIAPTIPIVAATLAANSEKWKQEKINQRANEDAAVGRLMDGQEIGDKHEARVLEQDDQFYVVFVWPSFAGKMKCLESMGIAAAEQFLKGEELEKLVPKLETV